MGGCNSARADKQQERIKGVNGITLVAEAKDAETGPDFLFEMENAQDEIPIPLVKRKYPPIPRHPVYKAKKTNAPWFDNWKPKFKEEKIEKCRTPTSTNSVLSRQATVTFNDLKPTGNGNYVTVKEVEEHARKAPRSVLKSFSELVKYLTVSLKQSPQCEILTVRSIIAWLREQKPEQFASGSGNKDTPREFLALIGQKKTTYSTFFAVLCRKAGIKCVKINGISKFGPYQPGDDDKTQMKDQWNAVYINGEWKIIHPYRTCACRSVHNYFRWIKFKLGNHSTVHSHKTSPSVVQTALNEHFFMANPSQFIYSCYPNDTRWQLIGNPVSREQFMRTPYLLPPFFGLGMTLKTEPKCLLQSKNGQISIQIESILKNASSLNMCYELFLQEERSGCEADDEIFAHENIQKLVVMTRNGNEWTFNIQFPIEGKYKLCLYSGPHMSPLLRICEFRLDCGNRKQNCLVLPLYPGAIGFGPTPISEEAGFFIPSHRNGYIAAKRGAHFKMIFRIIDEVIENLTIKVELIHTRSRDKIPVQFDIEHAKMLLLLKIVVPDSGDYVLTISTAERDRFLSESNSEVSFKTVCNYYISTETEPGFEHANKTLARKELENAFEGEEVNKLKQAIERCLKEKIDSNDDQIVAAKARLGFLETRNVVQEAFQRRNKGVVVEALQFVKCSEYKETLKAEIYCLEKFKEMLDSMGTITSLPPNTQESLSEVANIAKPHSKITDTLRALLMLLGESENSLTSWQKMTDLIHPGMGRNTAVYRMKNIQECRKPVNVKHAQKARRLLHANKLDDVKRINMAAATIYQWTDAVIGLCLNGEKIGEIGGKCES